MKEVQGIKAIVVVKSRRDRALVEAALEQPEIRTLVVAIGALRLIPLNSTKKKLLLAIEQMCREATPLPPAITDGVPSSMDAALAAEAQLHASAYDPALEHL